MAPKIAAVRKVLCIQNHVPQLRYSEQVGLTDDVPLKYTVTIREIFTAVKKAEVSLLDGH